MEEKMALALLYCLLTATCYAYYPVLAKIVKLEAMWLAILVNIGGLSVALAWNIIGTNAQKLTPKQIWIGLLIGVIAGIGTLFYSLIMTMEKVNLSTVIPIMLAMMPVMLAIFSYFFLGERIFIPRKMVALVMVAVGIFLLTYSPPKPEVAKTEIQIINNSALK